MNTNKFNADEATLSVDLSEARQAVKESRFKDALSLLEIILESQPDNIDGLYLAAVCSRYLKAFDESQKYIEGLLALAPDMGRAYQEAILIEIWAMKISQLCTIGKLVS